MTDGKVVGRTSATGESDPDLGDAPRVSLNPDGGATERPISVPVRSGWTGPSERITAESVEAAGHWDERNWRRGPTC